MTTTTLPHRSIFCLSLFLLIFLSPSATGQSEVLKISADEMKEMLTWLASDEMRGRNTPSPELDLAAEGLAERFEKAGLKPAFNGSFFQGPLKADASKTEGKLSIDGQEHHTLDASNMIAKSPDACRFENARLVQWTSGWGRRNAQRAEMVKQAVVVISMTAEDFGNSRYQNRLARRGRMLQGEGAVALLFVVDKTKTIDPASLLRIEGNPLPTFALPSSLFPTGLPESNGVIPNATCSITAPKSKGFFARNVGAIIEGTDPKLKDEFVVFSAHYDHIGVGREINGDSIYNGADDDGTGTTAVVSIAKAFAALKSKPKRSCLFLCFYGEEKGMMGSRFYVKNPAMPLKQHKVLFNIEMVGRPDDIEPKSAWVTGFGLSSFSDLLIASGKTSGITFYERPRLSAQLFGASDNISFAKLGIPAHSISAGSLHKDYHQPSDEVGKINFDNMAAVTQGIAHAAWTMVTGGALPAWSASPKAKRYRAAGEALYGPQLPKSGK